MTSHPKPSSPFEFSCPAPKPKSPDLPYDPTISIQLKRGRRCARERPQGGSTAHGLRGLGSRVLWGLQHPHYSLLLRSETDCKAVLFFSRAAFCCCETESKRETPRTAVTLGSPP